MKKDQCLTILSILGRTEAKCDVIDYENHRKNLSDLQEKRTHFHDQILPGTYCKLPVIAENKILELFAFRCFKSFKASPANKTFCIVNLPT